MGIALTCPGLETTALNESFDVLVRSLSFDGDYEKSNLCSGKLIIDGSVSFKRKETDQLHLDTNNLHNNSSPGTENAINSNSAKRPRFTEETTETPLADPPHSPKHEAAVKLQKVYKSFRTRRQLADCAVLIEQRWWKLLDFAMLKRSSVSFFDVEKPESAVSKWSRARTRAAKVGKGLSKNAKARKLALQHWLEAIDPRHRYGHNLHFYYGRWLRCECKQPFFYWLDVGEGKEVNLEACPRPKLQHQCIKYLGPKEREAYEVIVEDGRLIYKKSRQLLHTTGGPKDAKWIFVLSASKNLYVGLKRKGVFQHSSFLAGGATSSAGRIVVENGFLKAVWPHSGHYRPTAENFEEFMSFLKENNVALNDVKKFPIEEDGEWGSTLRSRNSRSDLTCSNVDTESPTISRSSNSFHELDAGAAIPKNASPSCERGLLDLENSCSFNERTMKDEQASETEDEKGSDSSTESIQEHKMHEHSSHEPMEGSSPSKGQLKLNRPKFFIEGQEIAEEEDPLPEELIIEKISSKKGMKPHKLGLQLPFKWTTASGARIGYVRNYPQELQFHALEQVSLSPRGSEVSRPLFSPRGLPSPCSKLQETSASK